MPLLDNELARRQRHPDGAETLVLRPEPARVRWALDDLPAADGFPICLSFVASVRPIDDPTERRMLREVLLAGRPSLTDGDISAHFAPTLRAAAAAAAKLKGAEAWLAPDGRAPLVDALKAAATRAAFACGLAVLAPFELDVESPAFQQHRLAAMQRTLAEQQAAGQVEHFARAAELLKRFQELRQAAPDLPPGRILEQLSPADRGSTLQTLLLAGAKSSAGSDLWAVAGEYLVRIDARGGPVKTALTPLPPTLGPVRSVQPANIDGQRALLVGARGGFMVVRPDGTDEPELYPDPSVQSQLGFSRVLYLGPDYGFVGCHGEAGIVRWRPSHHAGPIATVRPDRFAAAAGRSKPVEGGQSSIASFAGRGAASGVASHAPGPRNLQALGEGRVIFSVANLVWVMDVSDPDGARPLSAESEAEVVAIVVDGVANRAVAVHEDGTVCTLDAGSGKVACKETRGVRLRSAGALPWMGGTRLLLGAEDGPIQCFGPDDPLVTQYASAHRGLRVVTGSTDLVAGVSADRQRLLLWNAWDGRSPVAEVYLAGITRHRIADVEFG